MARNAGRYTALFGDEDLRRVQQRVFDEEKVGEKNDGFVVGKVAVVTGAGRMRSYGRSIAVELARAGCDMVLTGTGKSVAQYPDEERAAGWQDLVRVWKPGAGMGAAEDVAR